MIEGSGESSLLFKPNILDMLDWKGLPIFLLYLVLIVGKTSYGLYSVSTCLEDRFYFQLGLRVVSSNSLNLDTLIVGDKAILSIFSSVLWLSPFSIKFFLSSFCRCFLLESWPGLSESLSELLDWCRSIIFYTAKSPAIFLIFSKACQVVMVC